MSNDRPYLILMADDDSDDRMLLKDAVEESRLPIDVQFVEDGIDLMDYLNRRGQYSGVAATTPHLILLDLNMPRKDGGEALLEIKADPCLRHIPIVVLTTSRAERDIMRSYSLGASSYISKPSTFEDLVALVCTLHEYWVKTVLVPARHLGG